MKTFEITFFCDLKPPRLGASLYLPQQANESFGRLARECLQHENVGA